MLWIRVLVCASLLALAAPAQTTQPSSTGYLFRMQHATRFADACLLLRTDGSYRLEISEEDGRRVFDAKLPAAELAQMQALVQDPALKQLAQDKILVPLLQTRDFDRVWLSVARPNGWQNLEFPAPESREPVKPAMDRLLRLVRDAGKEPGASLPEAQANNCLPPGAPAALRTRPAAASASAARTQTAAPAETRAAVPAYLVVVKEHIQRGVSVAERKCVLVMADGRYRIEKSLQRAREYPTGEVFEATVPADALAELRTLLAGDELELARSADLPTNVAFTDGETTMVAIPRGDKVQLLRYGNMFGAPTGGLHALKNYSFGDRRPLKPLLQWVKTLEKRKLVATAGAVLNDCSAAPIR
jgi:hypothetical protein